MSKEKWIEAYESKVEDIAESLGIDLDTSNKILDLILDSNTGYLDDYWYN